MKTTKHLYLLLIVLALSNCSKETEELEIIPPAKNCTITSENTFFDPICEGYTPYPNSPLDFPLVVKSSEIEHLSYDDYSFEWSHRDYQSSLAGFRYEELPLSVTVTELATDCIVIISIDLDYWQ